MSGPITVCAIALFCVGCNGLAHMLNVGRHDKSPGAVQWFAAVALQSICDFFTVLAASDPVATPLWAIPTLLIALRMMLSIIVALDSSLSSDDRLTMLMRSSIYVMLSSIMAAHLMNTSHLAS